MRAAVKLFLIMYAPLALILTILFYIIFQIDETLQRSLLEIHSISQMTIFFAFVSLLWNQFIIAFYCGQLFDRYYDKSQKSG